eukprot:jgi/Mesvir1/27041/Mv20738-RA.1
MDDISSAPESVRPSGEATEAAIAAGGGEVQSAIELPWRPEGAPTNGFQGGGDKQQRRPSNQSSGRRLQGDHANHLLKFKYESRGERATTPQQRKPPPRKAKVAHPFNKEKFLATNFHFVVRWDAAMSRLHSSDAVLDWDTIALVDYSATDVEPYVCPLCLSPPVAPQVTRCGHIFCWPCALAHLSYAKSGYQRCALCFELVCAADLRSVQLRTVVALAEGSPARFRLLRRARDSLFPEAVVGLGQHSGRRAEGAGACAGHGGKEAGAGAGAGPGPGDGGNEAAVVADGSGPEVTGRPDEEGGKGEVEFLRLDGKGPIGTGTGQERPGCGQGGGADASGTKMPAEASMSASKGGHAYVGGASEGAADHEEEASRSKEVGESSHVTEVEEFLCVKEVEEAPRVRRLIGPGGVLICGHPDARFAKFTMLDAQGQFLREVRSDERQQLQAAVTAAVGDGGNGAMGAANEAVLWLDAALTHLAERVEQEGREAGVECGGWEGGDGPTDGGCSSRVRGGVGDAAPPAGEGVSQDAGTAGCSSGTATAPSPPQHGRDGAGEGQDHRGGARSQRDGHRRGGGPGRPSRGASAPLPEYYFYQEHVGQLVFIHPLNNRCLLREFGDAASLPPQIAGTVVEMESCRVDEDCRRRYHFLHHLPLGSSFWWAELDLKGMLSPATVAAFADETKQREARRRRQKAVEMRESAEARAAEEARRAGAVLPMHLFPELSSSTTGGGSGAGDAGTWVDPEIAVSAAELASEDAFPRIGGDAAGGPGASHADAAGIGDDVGEQAAGGVAVPARGVARGNGQRQGGGSSDGNPRGQPVASSPPVGQHSFSRITRMGYAADSTASGKEPARSPGNGHGWAAMVASRSPPQGPVKPGAGTGKPGAWGTGPGTGPGVGAPGGNRPGTWATGQDMSGVAAVLGGGVAAEPAAPPPPAEAKKKKGRGVVLLSLGAVRGRS